jgi:RNA polymerase sigma-70 factor, ECF subfamily
MEHSHSVSGTTSQDSEIQNNAQTRADDSVLIKMLQEGNQDAFVTLMRQYKEPITNFVYRFLGNYDDAVDVAQETFIRLYRYSSSYDGSVKFNTWLYTIASNLAKTELSKYWRKNSVAFSKLNTAEEDDVVMEVADESYMPDARVDSSVISQNVQSALMKISPSYREMIVLRDIQQLSYEEIATITNSEIGTVKSRINRGRNQLQLLLAPLYRELLQP